LPPRNSKHSPVWETLDILDRESTKAKIQSFDPEFIYHMAARTDLDGAQLGNYSPNTVGLENVISALGECANLKRVVFASSRLVCKIGYQPTSENDYCPTTIYGESKILGEEIVRGSSHIPCPWLMVRPTSIWGPWFDIPYKTFFLSIAKGNYFHPGSDSIRKSFGYVGNTVYQLDRLLTVSADKIQGKTIYLADYPPIEVRNMANAIQREIGTSRIHEAPLSLLKVAAIVGDVAKQIGWSNPPLSTFRLSNLITEMTYDLTLLEEIVGPLPFSMEQGIAETVAWLKAQKEI
jgi:nucleoside-diphosphate-sugar epimerase